MRHAFDSNDIDRFMRTIEGMLEFNVRWPQLSAPSLRAVVHMAEAVVPCYAIPDGEFNLGERPDLPST